MFAVGFALKNDTVSIDGESAGWISNTIFGLIIGFTVNGIVVTAFIIIATFLELFDEAN